MNRSACLATLLTCSVTWAAAVLSAAEPPQPTVEITLERRYLNIPVDNRAPRRRMSLTVDGKLLGQFGIPLAEDKPDWWAFFDVTRFQGQKMVINIDPPPQDWSTISQDNVIQCFVKA